jgi:Mn2+/Fe2+ NRAMP family transporter
MRRLSIILFWSIIAAAFIGPGTVTTSASAGARHGFALLWALTFSTFACLVLQEAAARITVGSGRDLGQALRFRFRGRASGPVVLVLVLGAVVLGCAAYQAGNVLGAVAGAALELDASRRDLVVVIGLFAALLLWFAATRTVALVLGLIVGVMGAAFLITAARVAPAPGELIRGVLLPTLPPGSGLLVVGLIGTTVVPYNLFLGSGIARGQSMADIRLGLAVSVTLGGLISMAVLVVGSAVSGEFGFAELATVLSRRLGPWAVKLFAFGLFAAGFSSALTAPMAAAVTARSLFGGFDDHRWDERAWRYRGVWSAVLLVGVTFGLADIRPIPAILLAQVFNGLILPFVAVFLLIVINDRSLVGDRYINGWIANAAMGLTVAVTVVLGASSLLRAATSALGFAPAGTPVLLGLSAGLAGGLAIWLAKEIRRVRG